MTDDSENIKSYTGLIFIGRCCERIGDHITNIAENVHYIKHGKTYIDGNVPCHSSGMIRRFYSNLLRAQFPKRLKTVALEII